MNGVTKETFQGYDTDSKLNTLYDYIVDIHGRVKKLERRKRFDTGVSSVSGVLGGMFAFFMSKLFKLG